MEYTLDTGLIFDPLDLTEEVTPEAVMAAISQQRFSEALVMALRLSDQELMAAVVEAVPTSDSESQLREIERNHGNTQRASYPFIVN